MEKKESQDQQQHHHGYVKRSAVWDCGSNLYDSYELKSFEQTLNSAIAARTMSMPRLPNGEHPLPSSAAANIPDAAAKPRKSGSSSKISRSVQKIVRAVLRMRLPRMAADGLVDGRNSYYAAPNPWFPTGGLTTIPEACEKGFECPPKPADAGPEVRKAASERFTFRMSAIR